MIPDYEQFQAIADLIKGDARLACAVLRSHRVIEPAFADAIADALETAKLHKGTGGRPRAMSIFKAEKIVEDKRAAIEQAVKDGITTRRGAGGWYESRLDESLRQQLQQAEDLIAHKKARRPKTRGKVG